MYEWSACRNVSGDTNVFVYLLKRTSDHNQPRRIAGCSYWDVPPIQNLFFLRDASVFCFKYTWETEHICRISNLAPGTKSDTLSLRAGQPGLDFRQCKILLLSAVSRPTVGPTQPPIQWVQGPLSLGDKVAGTCSRKLTFIWSYTSTPRTPSWHNA
jgi:hypothetical protein